MVTGRGDYILSSYRDDFIKPGVQEARLHTDHRMVLAVIRGKVARQKRRYVVGRTKWLLAAPTVQPHTEGGASFVSLNGEV